MKKNEDPYKGLLNLFRKLTQQSIQKGTRIGTIISPPPEIKIQCDGMILDKTRLYIDEYWVPGHTRHMVGETDFKGGGSGDATYESHNHPINNDESLTDTWAPGDKVSMEPVYSDDDNISGQQFIVHAKLRRFDGNG